VTFRYLARPLRSPSGDGFRRLVEVERIVGEAFGSFDGPVWETLVQNLAIVVPSEIVVALWTSGYNNDVAGTLVFPPKLPLPVRLTEP
jgi:hypothetical protein